MANKTDRPPKATEDKANNNVGSKKVESNKTEAKNISDLQKALEKALLAIDNQNKIIKEQSVVIEKLNKAEGSDNRNSDITDKLLLSMSELIKQNLSKPKMVQVIHLDNTLRSEFKLSNGEIIVFRQYGEVYPTSEQTATMLLNQYTNTFRRGALTFNSEYLYLLEEKGIDITKINYKPLETIKNVHNMSRNEINKMYEGLQYHQKLMLKSHIYQSIKKDSKYIDIEKIRVLDKLSSGGYRYIIDIMERKQ